jgi:hypothetical protein
LLGINPYLILRETVVTVSIPGALGNRKKLELCEPISCLGLAESYNLKLDSVIAASDTGHRTGSSPEGQTTDSEKPLREAH